VMCQPPIISREEAIQLIAGRLAAAGHPRTIKDNLEEAARPANPPDFKRELVSVYLGTYAGKLRTYCQVPFAGRHSILYIPTISKLQTNPRNVGVDSNPTQIAVPRPRMIPICSRAGFITLTSNSNSP
jgi:hypothetical protein